MVHKIPSLAHMSLPVDPVLSQINPNPHTQFFFKKNLKGGDRLEDLGIDGKMLEWILRK
jgi:hypothetical protein